MLYHFYKLGFFLARVLPIRFSYWIASLLAKLWPFFDKKGVRGLKSNLRVVLAEKVDNDDVDRVAGRVFRNFGKYLVDFFRFSVLTSADIRKFVKLVGVDNLDRALSLGKGAVVITLHMGNWELGGQVVAMMGYDISAIALEHSDKRIDDLFVERRQKFGMKNLPWGSSGVRRAFRALKGNGLLAIVADKDYTDGGVKMEFLGKPMTLPKGPAAFSVKTGAPVIFTAVIREPDDTFSMIFEDYLEPVISGDYERDIHDIMSRYMVFFEKYIKKYPDQWYVFDQLWDQI